MLGAAFKPDTDDIRDSPALNVAARLARCRRARDRDGPESHQQRLDALPPAAVRGFRARALEGAELVLLLTEWDEYRRLRPQLRADSSDAG